VTYFSAPNSFIVHTLYAAMTPEQQLRAFDIIPSNKRVRKFVISTNIAETSVTIPGIRYVVDPGLAKIRDLHSGSYVDMLHVCPVSQSQSNQRAGRAGREAPGTHIFVF
jgi:HrpA-like RNA helicase